MKRRVKEFIMLWMYLFILPALESCRSFSTFFFGLFLSFLGAVGFFALKKLWHWYINIPCINVFGPPFIGR